MGRAQRSFLSAKGQGGIKHIAITILLTCPLLLEVKNLHGRVVTRWPGSQEVGGSIPAATKIVRCKNLAFNIGECVSRGSDTT